jgi:glycosyltransferase involved in cell wall biosynthesis
MRVMISARTLVRDVGGNTRYARALVDGLAQRAIRVDLGQPKRDTKRAWAWYEGLEMQRRGRAGGADFVWYPADTGPVVRVPGVRTILTVHGIAALHDRTGRKPLANQLWLARTRRALRVADLVFTVSNSSRTDIARFAGDGILGKLVVAHEGVDERWFASPTHDEAAARATALGIHPPFLLYVGNIEPRKNLISLVQATDRLRHHGHEITTVIVGAPAWGAAPTLSAIAASPSVVHVGRLSDCDVRCLMALCDAFVFPSRYEGFGLPVLEAMASGCRVVATKRGALPEIAGDAVVYADDVSPDAIAEAITRAFRVPRDLARSKGRERAAKFTWERCVDLHVSALRCALDADEAGR